MTDDRTAAEIITERQRERWLTARAWGEWHPAPIFTENDDMAKTKGKGRKGGKGC